MAQLEMKPKQAETVAPATAPSKPQSKRLIPSLKQLRIPRIKSELLLLGGTLLAAVGLTITQYDVAPPSPALDPSQFCQEIVQPKAAISRDQLAQLLTIPERGDRTKVQNIIKEPYCRMPNLSIRAGAITERVVYPLDFDPQTWLIVLYEGKTYVGYGFKRA
ncbi:MAG: hypothetical protein LDL41_23920 [Coleofasciculus sp. S288]|nr:hypothetical protein [Coleofasciculus sp. S288]